MRACLQFQVRGILHKAPQPRSSAIQCKIPIIFGFCAAVQGAGLPLQATPDKDPGWPR